MSSVFEDFRRNLQQSFNGLHASHTVSTFTSEQWSNMDFSPFSAPLIPFTNPQLDGSNCFVRILFKLRGQPVQHGSFVFTWKDSVIDDKQFMNTLMPRMGTIQVSDNTVFLRRTPVRNYSRGYSPRYTSLSVFNPRAAVLAGRIPQASDYETVWAVFNPVFYSYNEALQKLYSGELVSAAIAPQLAIGYEEGRKYPLVVYRSQVIGVVQNNQILVYGETTDVQKDYIVKVTGQYVKVKG